MGTIAEQQAAAKAEMNRARARYFVLMEALNIFLTNKRNFSKNDAGMEPKEGYEKAFETEETKIKVIREMMQEVSAAEDRARKTLWDI